MLLSSNAAACARFVQRAELYCCCRYRLDAKVGFTSGQRAYSDFLELSDKKALIDQINEDAISQGAHCRRAQRQYDVCFFTCLRYNFWEDCAVSQVMHITSDLAADYTKADVKVLHFIAYRKLGMTVRPLLADMCLGRLRQSAVLAACDEIIECIGMFASVRPEACTAMNAVGQCHTGAMQHHVDTMQPLEACIQAHLPNHSAWAVKLACMAELTFKQQECSDTITCMLLRLSAAQP